MLVQVELQYQEVIMSQAVIFGMGVGGLMVSVLLVLWLAEPSRSARTYRAGRRNLRVEVSGLAGADLSDEAVLEALQGAMIMAERERVERIETKPFPGGV